MAQNQPTFGIDAPGVVKTLGLVGVALLIITAVAAAIHQPDIAALTLWPGCSMTLASVLMVLTSTVGKPFVIRRMIDQLQLRGDDQVLDVGCGRGLLLLDAARQLTSGKATGLDLWSTRDQSGNAEAATRRNAELANLSGRVQVDTGDMRQLPYAEASFDVIISSLAIHNLPGRADRERAVREIVRVLKPGGRIALLDFRHTGQYVQTLRASGITNATRSWPIFSMFPCVWIVRAGGSKT
ncbi:class I SAM-dependent methyltransferase [Rhodanobacter sp. BL-MT-08]